MECWRSQVSAVALCSPHELLEHSRCMWPKLTSKRARYRFGKWMAQFGVMHVASIDAQRGEECAAMAAGAVNMIATSTASRGDFMGLDFSGLLTDGFLNLVNESIFEPQKR